MCYIFCYSFCFCNRFLFYYNFLLNIWFLYYHRLFSFIGIEISVLNSTGPSTDNDDEFKLLVLLLFLPLSLVLMPSSVIGLLSIVIVSRISSISTVFVSITGSFIISTFSSVNLFVTSRFSAITGIFVSSSFDISEDLKEEYPSNFCSPSISSSNPLNSLSLTLTVTTSPSKLSTLDFGI